MAFQFPDPAVTTTVVNPETGITYQWKADPGKWVITTGEPEDDCLSTILTFIDGYDTSSTNPGEFLRTFLPLEQQLYLHDLTWYGSELSTGDTIYVDGVAYETVRQGYDTNLDADGNPRGTYISFAENSISFVPGEKYKFSYCPPVYPTGEFAPFTSSYRCVHPDDYTGEDGTCYGKTVSYTNDPEYNFANGLFVEWEFASRDLNGGAAFNDDQGYSIAFDYVFDPVQPGTYTSEQFGTFVITGRRGFRKYEGYVEFGDNIDFAENSIVYIRNPSQSPSQQPRPVYISESAPSQYGVNSKQGSLWWDSSEDQGVLYVRYENQADGEQYWVPASPPVSLDAINATIDSSLIIQGELQQRVALGESKQRTIENKVEALEGTVVDGVWKYGSRTWPQNNGEFDIVLGNNTKTIAWQDAVKLRIYKTDIKGVDHSFNQVSVSDLVRIGQVGSNAIYRILSEAQANGDYYEFSVEIVSYEYEAVEGILEYNFEFLPAFDATAYATKNYVDEAIAVNAAMPIGSIIFWGGTVSKIPSGWVECAGQTATQAVQELTGLTKIPNLKNYMPAGAGGVFGPTLGTYHSSKFKSHSHTVSRLEPGSTQGNPDGSADASASRYRYWRGNKDGDGSNGNSIARPTNTVGDSITAPPVYLGVYIMKVA